MYYFFIHRLPNLGGFFFLLLRVINPKSEDSVGSLLSMVPGNQESINLPPFGKACRFGAVSFSSTFTSISFICRIC